MDWYRAIDSHTEGEPTRVLLSEGPLAPRPLAAWLAGWTHATEGGAPGAWQVPPELLALAAEPRAPQATVCALLCPPSQPGETAGVAFYNSAGALGMCGHGMIGVAATLRYLGAVGAGEHRFGTPVGDVAVRIRPDGRVEIDNVSAFRHRAGVELSVGGRPVRGDVAWGGNWFFIVDEDRDLDLARADSQLAHTLAIRGALERAGVRGADGAVIDHVAIFGRPVAGDADSRNFVLCPNGSYDRSPCGTGTSAKLACLAADRRLAPGQVWRQESVIGSRFDAWYRASSLTDRIAPTIVGRAWITAEVRLASDPDDPARASGWTEFAEA